MKSCRIQKQRPEMKLLPPHGSRVPELHDFYQIDTRIEQAAAGLGLLTIGLECPVEKISGGQRARVILAKLLLEQPSVLALQLTYKLSG